MDAWFNTALGGHLLEREQMLLKDCLARRFGYHLLQLGCAGISMYESSPIGHKFTLTPSYIEGFSDGLSLPDAIPLQGECVDLALLHHALDFSEHQHQLLREVSRVLIAGGHLLILGFNPYSSWGLRRLLSWRKSPPWNAHMLSPRRLSDWLQLLDFQVDSLRYGTYCLPLNSVRGVRYTEALKRFSVKLNWPVGAFYLISARKQVAPLTPTQTKWRKMPTAMPMPVAENAGHGSHSHRQKPISREQ